MILLDDNNIIGGFAEYLKYGLIGLSAIVLILTYFLLYKEESRAGDARENVLSAIKRYMWTSVVFLVISGVWSISEKLIKPVQPIQETCNKKFSLVISVKPDSTMSKIDANDSLIVKYRVKKTETKFKQAPVTKGMGQNFIATIDSVLADEIYQVQLYDVTKKMYWENKEEISVTYNSAQLTYPDKK